MVFLVDERINSTCFNLGDGPLSRVFLKNDQTYPWFILVPRKEGIVELFQLAHSDRLIFMEEINQLTLLVHQYFKPEKLNVGALGNIVSQFHFHVVARNAHDPLWPHAIWQAAHQSVPYNQEQLNTLLPNLSQHIEQWMPRV